MYYRVVGFLAVVLLGSFPLILSLLVCRRSGGEGAGGANSDEWTENLVF
jgi:hypothetical protein